MHDEYRQLHAWTMSTCRQLHTCVPCCTCNTCAIHAHVGLVALHDRVALMLHVHVALMQALLATHMSALLCLPYTCLTYALHMPYTCLTHALHMAYTCLTYGLHMAYIWLTHALHMAYTWLAHECPAVLALHHHGMLHCHCPACAYALVGLF